MGSLQYMHVYTCTLTTLHMCAHPVHVYIHTHAPFGAYTHTLAPMGTCRHMHGEPGYREVGQDITLSDMLTPTATLVCSDVGKVSGEGETSTL